METKTAPTKAKSLKEIAPPKVVADKAPPPPEEPAGGGDFFAPGNMKSGIDDFVKQMKAPREKIQAPAIKFGDEEEDQAPEGVKNELEDLEEGTLGHFDYDEEHAKTAEFVLMTMDQAFSFGASLYSGENADKYNRFSGKRRPSEYQIDVTAAMLKKYQAKMSLEWMFATVVLMAFAPTFKEAQQDRSKARKKRLLEEEARRVSQLQGNFNPL